MGRRFAASRRIDRVTMWPLPDPTTVCHSALAPIPRKAVGAHVLAILSPPTARRIPVTRRQVLKTQSGIKAAEKGLRV